MDAPINSILSFNHLLKMENCERKKCEKLTKTENVKKMVHFFVSYKNYNTYLFVSFDFSNHLSRFTGDYFIRLLF